MNERNKVEEEEEGGVEGAGGREAHMCHGACVEVSGQLLGVGSLLPLWALGIELRLPKLLAASS